MSFDHRARTAEIADPLREVKMVISCLLPMLITWPIAFGSTTSFSQRPDHVGDVGEGALLVAVAEHRDRLAGQRLFARSSG